MSGHTITPERLRELEELLCSDLTFEEWLTEEDMAALLSVAKAHDDLVAALRRISEQDDIELALDPQWSKFIARHALSKAALP